MNEIGYCEGDVCNRDGCEGRIEIAKVENCSCHISPPCYACTEPRGYCQECDWKESDDQVYGCEISDADKESLDKFAKEMEALRNRPLDNTKIDYRIKLHSHISQICEGVYPEGTTSEEVKKVVNGTFGGRFEYFLNGKFKFIAYTD